MPGTQTIYEIVVDNDLNADLYFEPLSERIRGGFQPGRVKDESSGKLFQALPKGIAGQRVRLDVDRSEGSVIEPLATADAETKRAVAKLITGDPDKPVTFAPAVRITPNVHVGTWLGWMVRAVKSGLARETEGTLPDAVPADARPRSYSAASRTQDPTRPASVPEIIAAVGKLSPAERKELAAAFGAK